MSEQCIEYRLTKVLGRGTYGTAYLAYPSNAPEAKCVVKKISLEGMSQKEIKESLVEAKLLEEFQHPYILGHIDHWVSDQGDLYIVTELADKGDLQQFVKDAKKSGTLLPEPQIWSLMVQICLAMKHVHDRKVLHRDIKTANIFLTSSQRKQGSLDVKIGDFGICKVLEHTKAKAKSAVGTPYYMSPELCNRTLYDSKSDMWAVGCVAYELCTLKNPFDAANFNALSIKIMKGKYAPISSHYSAELHELVRCLLQQKPEKRPNMNELLEMPFMSRRLSDFWRHHPSVAAQELSHTVLHGFKALSGRHSVKALDGQVTQEAQKPLPRGPTQSKPTQPSEAGITQNKPNSAAGPTQSKPNSAAGPANSKDSVTAAPSGSTRDLEEVSDLSEGLLTTTLSEDAQLDAAARGEKFFFEGKTLPLGETEGETIHERVERLRLFLEEALGTAKFLQVYRLLQTIDQDTDETATEAEATAIVGSNRLEYLQVVTQLIFCEDSIRNDEQPAATVTAM